MTQLMSQIQSKVVGIPLSPDELSQLVGRLLSVNFKADIIQAEAREVDLGDVNMNACYDPDLDSMGRPCIEITLVYNPLENMLVLDDEEFVLLTRRIADVIAHEQIHQYQYRCRYWEGWEPDFDDDEDDLVIAQGYLSSKDEIDAYSHNIGNELLDYADYQTVLTLLQNPRTIKIEQSVNLWVYMATFGSTNHPVIRRLIKKIVKRLPELVLQR